MENHGLPGAIRPYDRQAISCSRLEAQVLNDDTTTEGDLQFCHRE
jgi:hypothetical protein